MTKKFAVNTNAIQHNVSSKQSSMTPSCATYTHTNTGSFADVISKKYTNQKPPKKLLQKAMKSLKPPMQTMTEITPEVLNSVDSDR